MSNIGKYRPDHRLTLAEAARMAGCSKDTIKRRLKKGAFPSARQTSSDGRRSWTVTAADLVADGLVDVAVLQSPEDAVAEVREAVASERASDRVNALQVRLARVEGELHSRTEERDFWRQLALGRFPDGRFPGGLGAVA